MTIQQIKSAAQARGFYDSPTLEAGKDEPNYYGLFSWEEYVFGKPFDQKGNELNLLSGQLKEELFNSLEKKIAYLQGVFEDLSEGCGVIKGESWIQFANSQNKVERCKKWLNEVAEEMVKRKNISNDDLFNIIGGAVTAHNILYYVPICHTVEIQPVVVKYIQNYKFSELC